MENKTLTRIPYAISCFAVGLIMFRYRQLFGYSIGGVWQYDYRLLVVAAIFGCFSFAALWKKALLPIWRKLGAASRVDGIFCVCALCLLLFPASRLNLADVNVTENRTLAKFPALWEENGRINEGFGGGVETWLSDRISGRKKLLQAYNKLNDCLSGGRAKTEKAFAGKQDWLFYINVPDGDPLKLFQNQLVFTDEQLASIHKNLEQQKTWLSSQGIAYVVLIAPNKWDIYGEYYPDGIHKVAPKERVSLLQEYLQEQPNAMQIVYPFAELLSHKGDGLLYYKNDTHWSPLGAYWGYRVLMAEVQKVLPDVPVLSLEDCEIVKSARAQGDLNPMLPSVDTAPYQSIYYDVPTPKIGKQYEESAEKKEESQPRIHTINPNGKYKAIVFRDSYSSALVPYLSESFHEALYIWSHNLDVYAEYIRQEQPDIVIHEMVSRYAHVLLSPTPRWDKEKGESH